MTLNEERIVDTWGAFQAVSGGLRRPQSEAEYLELHALADTLTSHYNCNQEPYASLFDLIASRMHAWELEHEPELKALELPPYQMLAYLMEQHGVSQYQLDKEGIAKQQNVSKILKGERGVSLALARKLAQRFGVGVELFV